MEKIVSSHLDANESAFFSRQLEYIKARIYETKWPALKATTLIPVSTEAGPGAESITFRTFTSVGMAAIISNYADDLPRADVYGEEDTVKVKGLGQSYGYNVQEIRNANTANLNLTTRKANSARRGIEQRINQIAWTGNAKAGLYGLLSFPNTSKNAATTGTWSTATADQILGDMFDAYDFIVNGTKGVEAPNQVLIPYEQYGIITRKRIGTDTSVTVKEFFEKARPGVMIESVADLKDVTNPRTGSGTTDVMVQYDRNPNAITLEIPQPFEQFPAQERNLEQVVPCHARIGGVIVYYPLSVNIVDGI